MGYSWDEVYSNGWISSKTMDCIPRTCDICGAPIHFTDTLTQVYCSNPQCSYKVANRLENMAKAMQVDGWGESTCISLVSQFHMVAPFQALLANRLVASGVDTGIANFPVKVRDLVSKAQEPIELWQMVQYASLPGVDSLAYKLFKDYIDVNDFYSDLENSKDGIAFIANKLGLKSIGTQAEQIYETLSEAKEELQLGMKVFNIKKAEGVEVKVAITGAVNGFKSKADYIKYLNSLFEGRANIVWAKSVSSSVDILVCDGDYASNKFRNASRINADFIESLNEDERELVGTLEPNKLKAIGEAIYIGDSKEVIERLHRAFG